MDLNTLFKIPYEADRHVSGCSLCLYLVIWFHIFLIEPQIVRPGMEGENSKPSDDLGSWKDHYFWSPPLIYFTSEACPRRFEWWVWL